MAEGHLDLGELPVPPKIRRRFRIFMTGFASVPSSRDLILQWAEAMVAARAAGRRIEAADAWIPATRLLDGAGSITHNPTDCLGVPHLHVFSYS
jgi:predicted nucleic acid-binding protein